MSIFGAKDSTLERMSRGRTDLVSGSWATLPGTTNSGNGSTLQQTLTNAINLPQQFFRVKQLP